MQSIYHKWGRPGPLRAVAAGILNHFRSPKTNLRDHKKIKELWENNSKIFTVSFLFLQLFFPLCEALSPPQVP